MDPRLEEVKKVLLALLGHDRWNSGLSDEILAEKIAITLNGHGVLSSAPSGQPGRV